MQTRCAWFSTIRLPTRERTRFGYSPPACIPLSSIFFSYLLLLFSTFFLLRFSIFHFFLFLIVLSAREKQILVPRMVNSRCFIIAIHHQCYHYCFRYQDATFSLSSSQRSCLLFLITIIDNQHTTNPRTFITISSIGISNCTATNSNSSGSIRSTPLDDAGARRDALNVTNQ